MDIRNMDFAGYDNPEMARRVYEEYIDKNTPKDIAFKAQCLVGEVNTAEDLDTGLDMLTTGHGSIHFCEGVSGSEDLNPLGWRENAIRALEDAS